MTLHPPPIAFLVAVALATAAPACKDDAQRPDDAERAPAPTAAEATEPAERAGDPAPAPAPQQPATAADAETYELSATQVGPLTADARATADALGALFPDAEVSAATATAEGAEYQVVKVALGGKDALVVSARPDGTVDRVRIASERFRMAGGVGVGSTFEELRALGQLSCTGGADDHGDSILCRPESAPTLAFVFPAGGSDANYAKPVPAAEQGQLLSGKAVAEILWQPAR